MLLVIVETSATFSECNMNSSKEINEDNETDCENERFDLQEILHLKNW